MERATGTVQPQAGPIVVTTGTVITQPIADKNAPRISRALDHHDGASLGAPSSYASPSPRGTMRGRREGLHCARCLLCFGCLFGFIGITFVPWPSALSLLSGKKNN